MSEDEGSKSNLLKSLYDLPDLQEGMSLGIERGSLLKSFVNQRIGKLELRAYGAGEPPFINLRDALEDSAWTPVEETANTYQQTVSVPSTLSGSYTPRLWEGDTELPSKGSVADVDAVPGSFHVAEASDAWTISYHPSGSGPPTSNNRRVYWAARPTAYVGSIGRVDGGVCEGLHIAHPLSNAGCVQMGPGGTVRQCLLQDGGKHNLVHAGGRIEDVICLGSTPTSVRGPLAQSAISWFQDDNVTTPQDIVERNFIIVGTNGLASLGHTNGAGFTQAEVKGHVEIDTAFGGRWPEGAVIEGLYTRHSGTAPSADVIRYGQLDGNGPQRNGGNDNGVVVEDSVILYQALTRNLETGVSVTLRRCTVFAKDRQILRNVGGDAYDLTLEHCVLVNLGRGIGDSGASIDGDHCVFFDNRPDRELNHAGETLLADLQSATGGFANSAWLTVPQFRSFFQNGIEGWLRGDVRLNPDAAVTTASGDTLAGELPDGTPVADVGPQKHWDWAQTRPADGPPTQWPTPPETEEEGKRYISNPADWDWTQSPPTYIKTVENVLTAAYEMGQASGDEPDLVGTNDARVVTGNPGRTDSPYGTARTFNEDALFRTKELIFSDSKAGALISTPVLISSLSSSSALVSSKSGSEGVEVRIQSDGSVSAQFGYYQNPYVATLETPSDILSTDTWYLIQAWFDIIRGQVGVRVNDTEYHAAAGLLNGVRNDDGATVIGAQKNKTSKIEGAIGRLFFWDISPSRTDRDWLYNGGDYRSFGEVQNYSTTVPNP